MTDNFFIIFIFKGNNMATFRMWLTRYHSHRFINLFWFIVSVSHFLIFFVISRCFSFIAFTSFRIVHHMRILCGFAYSSTLLTITIRTGVCFKLFLFIIIFFNSFFYGFSFFMKIFIGAINITIIIDVFIIAIFVITF